MKSIVQRRKECYFCHRREGLHEHHIFEGKGRRQLSEKYGLKVYLCGRHHNLSNNSVHRQQDMREMLYREGQRAFERAYPQLDFLEVFSIRFL